MVLIVSKGYEGERKTSVMRHGIGIVEAKSFAKIEMLQEDLFALNNEFFITYYADSKIYEKRFLFEKNSIAINALSLIPLLEKEGMFAK